MFLFAKIDYHKMIDFAPWAYGVCIVSLLAVLAVGHKALGRQALDQDSAPCSFRPSEWSSWF